MAVLQVAPNGKLAGAVSLGRPLAPVKGVQRPRRHVVAGARLVCCQFVPGGPGQAVGEARVGARADVGEPERGIGDVARARGGIFGLRRRHELRRRGTAAGCGRRVWQVARAATLVGRGRAGARVGMQAQTGLAWCLVLVGLVVGLGLLHAGEAGAGVGRDGGHAAAQSAGLQHVGHGAGALVARQLREIRGGLLEVDVRGTRGRVVAGRERLALVALVALVALMALMAHAGRHVQLVVLGEGTCPPLRLVLL